MTLIDKLSHIKTWDGGEQHGHQSQAKETF